MELLLLLKELFLTAFLALILSFVVTKLLSFAVAAPTGDHVKSNKRGANENVNLDRGLKVEGARSKKRFRFAVEEAAGKVDHIRGVEGSVGELEEYGKESCGNKGGNVEGCLEEKRVQEIVEEEIMLNTYLGQLILEEKIENEVGIDDIGENQSEEVVSGMEEIMVNNALDESIVAEKNGNEEIYDEKIVGLNIGDVIGDQSEVLKEVVGGERSMGNSNEGSSGNTALDELTVAEKSVDEDADDDICMGVASDDVVGDRSGEFRVLEELVEERKERSVKEGDIVLDENEEADDGKIVGLINDDVVGDQTGRSSVLKVLLAEDKVETSVKEEKRMSTELVVEEKIEEAGNETNATFASEGVVCDEGGEERVLEIREDQGSGIGGELDKGYNEGEGLVSDEDDDWEGIERSDLEKVFATAANYVDYGGKNDRSLNLGTDVQMQLYGLHKVATEGPCYDAQPMALMVSARAKWNAWQRLGNMSPEVAMEQYVSLLSDKDPEWMQGHYSVDGKPNSSEVAIPGVPETNLTTSQDKQTNSMES